MTTITTLQTTSLSFLLVTLQVIISTASANSTNKASRCLKQAQLMFLVEIDFTIPAACQLFQSNILPFIELPTVLCHGVMKSLIVESL